MAHFFCFCTNFVPTNGQKVPIKPPIFYFFGKSILGKRIEAETGGIFGQILLFGLSGRWH